MMLHSNLFNKTFGFLWHHCLWSQRLWILIFFSYSPCHLSLDIAILKESCSSEAREEIHLKFLSKVRPNEWGLIHSRTCFLKLFNVESRLIHINIHEEFKFCFRILRIVVIVLISVLIFFVSFFKTSLGPWRFGIVNVGDEIHNPAINWWIDTRTTSVVVLEDVLPEIFVHFFFSVGFDDLLDDFNKRWCPPF